MTIQRRQQSYIDAEGALHEDGDVYIVAKLYSPAYYTEQNPIILTRKRRTLVPATEVAQARRTRRLDVHPLRAALAWLAQKRVAQNTDGLEEDA